MRTHKDAKAMAKSLRSSLAARNVFLSHSECLEIVAKQFGFVDWNTLAATLHAQLTASCSFCGKPSHQVRTLVEGGCSNRGTSPCVFICDECVALSAQVNAERLGDSRQSSDIV